MSLTEFVFSQISIMGVTGKAQAEPTVLAVMVFGGVTFRCLSIMCLITSKEIKNPNITKP